MRKITTMTTDSGGAGCANEADQQTKRTEVKKSEVIVQCGGTVRDWRKHKTGGGWVHKDANVSESAYVGPRAIVRGGTIRGGTIYGGIIRGGTIYDGIIRGGIIYDGIIRGGIIRGGTIYDGIIRGGIIYDGIIRGGIIYGGTIYGGTIYDGTHHSTPAQASRSDGYMFTAYYGDDVLRITAGCRNFTWDQAVAHWGDPKHHKHAESMRIIKYLRAEVEARCEK